MCINLVQYTRFKYCTHVFLLESRLEKINSNCKYLLCAQSKILFSNRQMSEADEDLEWKNTRCQVQVSMANRLTVGKSSHHTLRQRRSAWLAHVE